MDVVLEEDRGRKDEVAAEGAAGPAVAAVAAILWLPACGSPLARAPLLCLSAVALLAAAVPAPL